MDALQPMTNAKLIAEENEYYSRKFKELRLTKRRTDYNNAIFDLKDEQHRLSIYNGNICAFNISDNKYHYIKKEDFEDYLNDDEKAEHYINIKKFVYTISRARWLLKEWEESIKELNASFKADQKIHDGICFNKLNEAMYELQRISIYAPVPMQPTNPYQSLNENIEPQHPSKEAIELLYNICDGNIENLKIFAEFCYKLKYEPKTCLSTVILADESIHDSLKHFFELLFYPKSTNDFLFELQWHNFKDLYSKDVRTYFSELEFKKITPVILINGKTIFKNGAPLKYFRKLLSGKRIPVDSPYFDDELIIKNSTPTIYITDDKKIYLTMKSLYNSEGIKTSSKELILPEILSESYEWLCNEFLCIGKKIFKKTLKITKNSLETRTSSIDHEKIVKDFLKKYCTFATNKDCTKKDLHSVYTKYFNTRFLPTISLLIFLTIRLFFRFNILLFWRFLVTKYTDNSLSANFCIISSAHSKNTFSLLYSSKYIPLKSL